MGSNGANGTKYPQYASSAGGDVANVPFFEPSSMPGKVYACRPLVSQMRKWTCSACWPRPCRRCRAITSYRSSLVGFQAFRPRPVASVSCTELRARRSVILSTSRLAARGSTGARARIGGDIRADPTRRRCDRRTNLACQPAKDCQKPELQNASKLSRSGCSASSVLDIAISSFQKGCAPKLNTARSNGLHC